VVRQSQTYFAAAVSAAALNAAAIAAFVLFMVLSSVHGSILGLVGSANPVRTAPASSSASPTAAQGLPRDGGLEAYRGTTPRYTDPAARGSGSGTGTHASGADPTGGGAQGDPDQSGGPAGSPGGVSGGPSGGASSPGAPGGVGSGPIDGTPDPPSLLTDPPAIGPTAQGTVQQLGGTVQQAGGSDSGLSAVANNTVGNTVDSADSALGGRLTNAGVSPAVQNATGALLGPG
jgi:hypothetical protein